MASGEQRVVLILPAGTRFGAAARSALGELARRGAVARPQWARLEAAVDRTLRLLQRQPGDRVRLTFGGHPDTISVEAELTTDRGAPVADRGKATPADVARWRSALSELVDAPEVDPGGTRVRFRAPSR